MNFWQFCDRNPVLSLIMLFTCALVFETPFKFGYRVWKMQCRSRNIAAHGWPPEYLDADGDIHRPEQDDD